MTTDALSIAKQLNPNQRLMLAQVHLGDDIKPRSLYDRDDLANKHQLITIGGAASVYDWNLNLTPLGQQVAEVVALASYQTLTDPMAELLLTVETPAYHPKNVNRNQLSALALIRQDEKAGTATLTTLGRQVAALVLMDGPPAAADAQPDAIDEEPTPIFTALTTPPVDTKQPLNGAEETMLFQVLHKRPIRPRTPATRDVLVQRGLITVSSEAMWDFALTPTGEEVAQRLELLDFVPVSDRSRLWSILQGERIHEREMTDTPNHLKLVTYDETDGEDLGIASLTESGEHHAERIVEYVAKKLMDFYPNRVQALIQLYRVPGEPQTYSKNNYALQDWGLTEGDTLTDFGRAVAAALQIMEPGYALADITPPALPEEAPGSQWPDNLPSPEAIAQYSTETGISVEDVLGGLVENLTEDTDNEAPAEEEPAPAPIEEPEPAHPDTPTTDDRAALLGEIERLSAALVEASEALGSEWMKGQDKRMISKKIADLHKHTQYIIRSNSEAASRRSLQVEADNIALRQQMKATKQAAAAPSAGDPDDTAILRGHLSEVMSERDNIRAQLDEANQLVVKTSRDLNHTSRQLADSLDAIKKHAEETDTATRRADRAETDLHTIQQAAQRWQAEHAAAVAEATRLNGIVEQLTAEIPAGHIILNDATPAHLDRLTAEQRTILVAQFSPDGSRLYVVAGPTQRPQPQPDKPAAAADHFDAFDNMVYDDYTEIIDEDPTPAPEPELEPVYVFSDAEPKLNNSTTPDHAKQMVELMRAGVPADRISAELNKSNEAVARDDFAKRQAASFGNPPVSRTGPPPRRFLPTGQ